MLTGIVLMYSMLKWYPQVGKIWSIATGKLFCAVMLYIFELLLHCLDMLGWSFDILQTKCSQTYVWQCVIGASTCCVQCKGSIMLNILLNRWGYYCNYVISVARGYAPTKGTGALEDECSLNSGGMKMLIPT